MANLRILFFTLLISLSLHVCRSDEDSDEDGKKDSKLSFDDLVGEPLKGMGDFFKGAADAVSGTAENGMESLKGLSAGVKEKSEAGAEMAKGFADGLGSSFGKVKETSEAGAEMAKGFADGFGSSFGKAKDKLVETGEKMKEAVGDAALNTKEEVETAASKLSKHAKDASDTVMKMFG